MDPTATLKEVEEYLRGGQLAEALAALEAYWAWRRGGGFEPVGGDALARRLAEEIKRRRGGRRPPESKKGSDT